jgi:hypothetical protein
MTMIDVDHYGVEPRTDGTDEVVIPAPTAVTLFVKGPDGDTNARLCVGWNSSGSPIVMGDDGGLRMLDISEQVCDCGWQQ